MELQLFFCLRFFSNSILDFRTEWNWIEFSDMQSESVLKMWWHEIPFSGCLLFQLTRYMNLSQEHYFNFLKMLKSVSSMFNMQMDLCK